MVADRLWLVKDGAVKPYEEDLQAYRQMLLQADTPPKAEKPKPVAPKRASRDQILALRSDARKCEERIEKLSEMEEKLQARLADPTLFTDRKDEAVMLQKKYAELKEAMERAEELWMVALEKLERAESA
jgi:ATP-binding cassette subfamily F protein 3